jgi:hypothetical protein
LVASTNHSNFLLIIRQPQKSGRAQQSEPKPCTAGSACGGPFFSFWILVAKLGFRKSNQTNNADRVETRTTRKRRRGTKQYRRRWVGTTTFRISRLRHRFSSLFYHHQPHDNSSSSSSQRSNETGEKEEAAAVIHRSSTTPKNTERQPDDVVDYGWKSIEELMCPTTLYNNSCFKSGLTISEYSCCRVPADGGTY